MADTVNDFIRFGQAIEGQRIADLQWGTPDAKSIVVVGRIFIGSSTPLNQHPCLSIMNGAKDRSFVVEIAESTPDISNIYYFSVAIPGDTAGVWTKDNTVGMHLFVSLYAGTAMQTATLNAWQAGAFYGSNRMNTSEVGIWYNNWIGNMGLYADPYKTGVAPPFETPNFADDLRRCQRYWYRLFGTRGGSGNATTPVRMAAQHPVQMRAFPAASLVGTVNVHDGAAPAVTAIIGNHSNTMAAEFDMTTASGLTAGRPAAQYFTSDANYIAMSARM